MENNSNNTLEGGKESKQKSIVQEFIREYKLLIPEAEQLQEVIEKRYPQLWEEYLTLKALQDLYDLVKHTEYAFAPQVVMARMQLIKVKKCNIHEKI